MSNVRATANSLLRCDRGGTVLERAGTMELSAFSLSMLDREEQDYSA